MYQVIEKVIIEKDPDSIFNASLSKNIDASSISRISRHLITQGKHEAHELDPARKFAQRKLSRVDTELLLNITRQKELLSLANRDSFISKFTGTKLSQSKPKAWQKLQIRLQQALKVINEDPFENSVVVKLPGDKIVLERHLLQNLDSITGDEAVQSRAVSRITVEGEDQDGVLKLKKEIIDADGEKKIDKMIFNPKTKLYKVDHSSVGNEPIIDSSKSQLLIADYLQNLSQNSDTLRRGNFYLNVTQENSSDATKYEVFELMDLQSRDAERNVQNPAPVGDSGSSQLLKESTVLYQKKDKDGKLYLEASRTDLENGIETKLKFEMSDSIPQLLSTSINIRQG